MFKKKAICPLPELSTLLSATLQQPCRKNWEENVLLEGAKGPYCVSHAVNRGTHYDTMYKVLPFIPNSTELRGKDIAWADWSLSSPFLTNLIFLTSSTLYERKNSRDRIFCHILASVSGKCLYKFSNSSDSLVSFCGECFFWSFFNLIWQIQSDHTCNVFDSLGKEK